MAEYACWTRPVYKRRLDVTHHHSSRTSMYKEQNKFHAHMTSPFFK